MLMTSIDIDGKILIPAEIRTQLDLNAGDELLVYNHKDCTIILEKVTKTICFEKWANR